MVLITSNSNEDTQGTQLRVSKKLTTVCSGKRSRFSKPRPNLAISKRGETNVSASAGKSREKSFNEDIQNQPLNTDINKKSIEEKEDSSHEDSNEIVLEDPNLSISSTNLKILNADDEFITGEDVEKLFPDDEIPDTPISTNADAGKTEKAIQNTSSTNQINTSKENDIQSSPVKSVSSPLKVSESEKRSLSSSAPTVIDKSKYPQLTSILSKKRTEPRKEAQQKKRRKFKKGDVPPERSKMTMADLIYWNPVKTDEPKKNATPEKISSTNVVVEEEEEEEEQNVDDAVESENILDSVPKLVISEDGQINIDQSSLFVSRNVPQPISTEVVRKDDTTYSSFRKRPLTKHWTGKDTAKFYRALSLVGADFSLMEQIFPTRTRRELKQKFKREEKFNIDLINKVLYESQTFDELTFNNFIDENNAVDDQVSENNKQDSEVMKGKSRKRKTDKKAKSAEWYETSDSSVDPPVKESEHEKSKKNKRQKKKVKKLSDDDDEGKGNDTGKHTGSKRKRNAKKLPDDFISTDSIQDLELSEDDDVTNDQGVFEKVNSSENQENSISTDMNNEEEEMPFESACSIFNKIMNGTADTDIQQNIKKEKDNAENENSKKKRGRKKKVKLVDEDSVAVTDLIDNNSVVTENSSENQNSNSGEMEKNVEEVSSETACTILNKIMNETETTGIQHNIKKEKDTITVTLPTDINNDQYISIDCIRNDGGTDVDIGMLGNVVAYEVVNTQTQPPKRRRKFNPLPSVKARDHYLATKIPPTNYTNYTPV